MPHYAYIPMISDKHSILKRTTAARKTDGRAGFGIPLFVLRNPLGIRGLGVKPPRTKLVPFVKTVLRQFYGKLRLINDSRIIVSDIFQTELSLTSFRSNTNRPTGYDSWKQSI